MDADMRHLYILFTSDWEMAPKYGCLFGTLALSQSQGLPVFIGANEASFVMSTRLP